MSEITPPSTVMDLYPTLKPLIDLIHARAWVRAQGKTHACEVASTNTPKLPTTAYRMSLDIPATVETLAHVIEDEDYTRQYDPTMDRCDILERRRDGVLLYTSYKQQTWLVAPRDFCVLSASAILDSVAAKRRRIIPDSLTLPSGLNSLVYVQSNVSCLTPRCQPGYGGGKLVRGQVHIFGYVVYEISTNPPVVHVDNYCCVEPGGSIPSWVANAAIGQNCEKLQRIKELAASLQKSSPRPCLRRPSVGGPSVPAGVSTEAAPPPLSPAASTSIADLAQPESSFFPPPRVVDTQVYRSAASYDEALYSGGSEAAQAKEAQINALSASPLSTDSLGVQNSLQTFHTPNSSFSITDEDTQENRSRTATQPHSVNARRGGNDYAPAAASPPPSSRAGEGAGRQVYISDDADAELMARRVCGLARAFGWATIKEEADCLVERLDHLPASVSQTFPTQEQHHRIAEPGVPAVRVSTVLSLSLDTVKEVLRSDALSPDADANIFRSATWRPRGGGGGGGGGGDASRGGTASSLCPGHSPGGGGEAERGCHRRPDMGALPPWQLRHYVYDKTKDCPAFDLAMRCTEVELPQVTGAALGLHATGVRAGSVVWGGLDAGEEVLRDPHKEHRRATVFVYGWTAVAIPVAATSLRVSCYASLDVLSWCGDSGGALVAAFSPRESAALLHRFTNTLLSRMVALRHLAAATSLSAGPPLITAGLPMQAVDGTPLLHMLDDIDHAAQAQAGNSYVYCCEDGVSLLLSAEDGGLPPGLHLSLTFPCSVEQFADYVLCARRRLRTLDPHLHHHALLHEGSHASTSLSTGGSIIQLHFGEGSRLRPSSRYTMVESAGFLDGGNTTTATTFVLARINCQLQDGVEGRGGEGEVSDRTVFYDGFVARQSPTEEGKCTVTRHLCAELPPAVAQELSDILVGHTRGVARRECPLPFQEMVSALTALRERVVAPSALRGVPTTTTTS